VTKAGVDGGLVKKRSHDNEERAFVGRAALAYLDSKLHAAPKMGKNNIRVSITHFSLHVTFHSEM
jgi:hypothetical protein